MVMLGVQDSCVLLLKKVARFVTRLFVEIKLLNRSKKLTNLPIINEFTKLKLTS